MLVETLPKPIISAQKLSFREFLTNCPEEGNYELINGKIMAIAPLLRSHQNVASALMFLFYDEIRRLKLDYIVDNTLIIQTGEYQARKPDVSIVKKSVYNANVDTYNAMTTPIELAIEIVSNNWEDDYEDKVNEYEKLGILEYWIVDYLAQGPRKLLGNPKIPMIFVHQLIEGNYQTQYFQGEAKIISPTFPELMVTANQIFASNETGEIN
jgi:Uma2 family endonuclease